MKSKIVIQSNVKELNTIYQWLETLLEEAKVDKNLSQTILLITQEIATNAILHGNKEITNKNVTVQAHIRLKEIVIDISDEGDGIQTLPTKKEATELNYLEEGGRGLKLAVLMSDDIELYQNKIRLIFNRYF
ncbi:MAG TPA: ATP-binding protein [Campylobacterales bacterium]|nr:ATP-binding protein [Campylobacterales bacterium]